MIQEQTQTIKGGLSSLQKFILITVMVWMIIVCFALNSRYQKLREEYLDLEQKHSKLEEKHTRTMELYGEKILEGPVTEKELEIIRGK